MQSYENKQELIAQIKRTASLFIGEFDAVEESDRNVRIEGVDRTPLQMIAYQLGWLDLIMQWERDETAGKLPVTPAEGYRWNQLGGLYQSFYDRYDACSLAELQRLFMKKTEELTQWLERLPEEVVFLPGSRGWAASTPSNWPVWKWVHMNSVAPFQSFRSKIRKWKKLHAA